jgi:hypothetical protein
MTPKLLARKRNGEIGDMVRDLMYRKGKRAG